MKLQQRIKRKRAKARERRKNYTKKINVKRNNKPTPRKRELVPVLSMSRDENGKIEFKDNKARYKVIGEKEVVRKMRKELLSPGDGVLPKGKKIKERKEKNVI